MATVNSTASSQVAYSYLQSKNKIGGLVSGMDIDSIMEKLMKAESAQMEKLQQQKTKYEWKRDAYREVNTKLNTFQQDLFDKYGLKSSWNSKTATTSPNSSISVKAGTSASGNLTISNVTTAKAASQKFDTDKVSTAKMSVTSTLSSIGLSDDAVNDFSIFGAVFSADTKDVDDKIIKGSTIQDVITALDDNGYTATITNGQMKLVAKEDSKEIDADTQKSLEKLGFTFSKTSQQSTTLKTTDNKVATKDTKLADLNSSLEKITIDGKEINFADLGADAKVSDVLKKIQDEGYNASITNGKLSISSKDKKDITVSSDSVGFSATLTSATSNLFVENITGDGSNLQGSNTIQDLMGGNSTDSGMFTLSAIQEDGTMKNTTITYKKTDTISSLMSKINSSGAGVTALFNDGQFSLSANNTGARTDGSGYSEISLLSTVKDEGGNDVPNTSGGLELFGKLTGIDMTQGNPEISLIDASKGGTRGSQAAMTVNGVKYEQASNVFNVAGYDITATADTASNEKITISSSNDTDKAVDKVKAFVESYNALIEELNSKTTEKKKVGYDPLTDAQKAEMSESEITKWEETAKAGLLKGDTTLNSVLSKMRQTLFTYGTSTSLSTNGTALGIKGETLASLGISTSSTWSDNGKLEINEDKLRAAIEKDPDVLARVFTGDGTKENPGIVSQLRTTAQDAVKTIERSAGKSTSASETSYSIGKSIASLTTKIDDWKDRLKDIEERYWKQFSAMETAIQKANNQSSIFAQ